METLSLYELNEYIQRVFALNFPESIWVHFELSNLKSSRGHLYFDCVEKDESTDEVIAFQSGVIWARRLSFIRKKLKKIADEILCDGIVIAAKVNVEFHPRYGAKMVIQDIDPAYTYGQLALEREQTIKRLEDEELIDANAELALNPVIQNIAIVSNETAAGYQDFVAQLKNNTFGYAFQTTLFETALQGKNVETELPDVLTRLDNRSDAFDVIVIIRGGGSKLDLSAFDSYKVAHAIATASIPVWTGIGHQIDESVADLVSANSLKTPTAVANAIIDHNYDFEVELLNCFERIKHLSNQIVRESELELLSLNEFISTQIDHRVSRADIDLSSMRVLIDDCVGRKLEKQRWTLESIEAQIALLDPINILKKGYAVIEKKNKRVGSSTKLKTNDEVTIQFHDGKKQAKVQ
jgi:exodeoxyribonuclease VII large subunit